jgi:hypothetical protein
MGPGATSHIVAPQWQHEVVLFRQGDELGCRTSAKISIYGVTWRGRSKLRPKSRVEGAEFARLETADSLNRFQNLGNRALGGAN